MGISCPEIFLPVIYLRFFRWRMNCAARRSEHIELFRPPQTACPRIPNKGPILQDNEKPGTRDITMR